ncbi:uncharacterized protein [Argopecten irradians]|uniref:uncharacterized protein n=1 Tax=Argopecten irradians TaxID=31199 RepID=UPI0037121C3B
MVYFTKIEQLDLVRSILYKDNMDCLYMLQHFHSTSTPVFIKADSVLGGMLLAQEAGGSFLLNHLYDMIMAGMQNLSPEQALEENAVLGVEFWESLKNGTVWWITVPNGLYVYTYGQHLDFGSASDQNDLILYGEHYDQYLEEYHFSVETVEESDPSQDRIDQEIVKHQDGIRIIKDKWKFTDNHIRNAVEDILNRGEEVTFARLLTTLSQRQEAVVNDYVGTRQYAFSTDVQLVLEECYEFYGREPTHEEFDLQYNRIKGTGIEHLINQLAEKEEQVTSINRDKDRLQERARVLNNQVVIEQTRAVQERNRADQQHREKLEAQARADKQHREKLELKELANAAIDGIIQEQNKRKEKEEIEKEKEEERIRLEKEKEEERIRLEKEKEEERIRLEKEKEEERIRLEKEKEEERIRLEKEKEEIEKEKEEIEKEKEEERIRLEKENEQLRKFFEEEKRKMMAQFEAEKRQLLLQMQQGAVYAR